MDDSPAAAPPPQPADAAVDRRARQLLELFPATPATLPEGLFSAAFLAAVPPEQILGLARRYGEQCGQVDRLTTVEHKSPRSARYRVECRKKVSFPMNLAVSGEAPGSLVSAWFGAVAPLLGSLAEVVAELRQLPGRVSFAACELDPAGPRLLVELGAEEPLAIGSTFKLYVFGGLLQQIARGERRWSDTLELAAAQRSLPSGQLQDWPVGAPVTVHTLASLMLSRSDNTATDHLLHQVGREQVEAMLEPMGNRAAPRNRPFLSTAEMFRVKASLDGPGGKFVALPPGSEQRRALLQGELAALPLPDGELDDWEQPRALDTAEWFASAADLCRAMHWLRQATEQPPAAAGRALLAINRGSSLPRARFAYLGYKGGSEPGVLNQTYLIQRRDGRWLALAAGWNDPGAPLDEDRFFGLVSRALELLAD